MSARSEAPSGSARRLGSYTTALVTAGRVTRLERHAGRLRRDAERLDLPLPSREAIEQIFLDSARETFGDGDGIVRVEWSHLPGEPPELIATPREYRPLPSTWRARVSKAVHPGLEFRANTKYVDVSAYDLGREEVAESEVDEVLLFDADGFLVEGAHSNFIVVLADGRIVTPAAELGGVEGLGLTIVREGHPEIEEARLTREEVDSAQELMSVNAVRGPVAIIELDGRTIGSGRMGEACRKFRQAFFRFP